MFTVITILKSLALISSPLGNLPQLSLISAPLPIFSLPLLVLIMPPNLTPNYIASYSLTICHMCTCTADLSRQAPHLLLLCVSVRALHERVRAGMHVPGPPRLCPTLPPVAEISKLQQGAWDPAAPLLQGLGWEGNWVLLLFWAALYIPQKVPCQNLEQTVLETLP